MSLINLDFCIIKNPLNEEKSPIIFVTRQGKTELDVSIINDEDYEKAIHTIQKLGYVESDILTFEFSQDPDFPIINQDSIKKTLESHGMKYSKKLEKKLQTEFLNFKKEEDKYKKSENSLGIQRFFVKSHSKFRVPEVGEKISLYFYLFIECKFKENNCYLNLNGDFFSKVETNTRNYIQIIKCNFIRVNNVYNPNKIILKSCLNHKQLLRKVKIYKSGSFTKEENGFGKIFVYHLMEVKNSIPEMGRVTIEVDNMHNFDNMILTSKHIKKEYGIEMQREVSKNTIKDSIQECKKILEQKMLKNADDEEFEKAAIIKKDITYINSKLLQLSSEQDVIPLKTVDRKYHIN